MQVDWFVLVYLCTINDMRSLKEWIEEATGNASWRSIANRLGTTHATAKRRLQDNTASAVIELAEAYDANPIAGLIAAGLVNETHLANYQRRVSLEDYDDLELAQEIVNRIEQRQSKTAKIYDLPLGAVADSSPEEGGGSPDDYEP